MNTAYLVPGQTEKLISLQARTYLRTKLGDPERFPSVKAQMTALQDSIVSSATKAKALAGDLTRTKPQLHLLGKEIAMRASAPIRQHAELFARKAVELMDDGKALADSVLGPREGYGYVDSEIRGWIRDQVKTPEGMQAVSTLYKSDKNVASVLYSSPYFLLGISEALHGKMAATAVEKFAPKGAALLTEGAALSKIVGNYESVVSDIHNSFYSAEVVAKAEASRVEVD
ncbi:hypothetical protein [Anianabacter salinae]|uniref:hypothetical protein n=1 Tax=Anianabacter salinae TaxID=2851023 RepID=UPI00225E6F97|nr:hypothetical protein [Anianabacter salinae]MBV0910924.1 hypothetical protein [Anianabacter salinae]